MPDPKPLQNVVREVVAAYDQLNDQRAMYFEAPGGTADGALTQPEPSCEPATVQAALHLRAEDLTHRKLEVSWQPTDRPGWWTGVVTKAGPVANADR